MNQADEYSLGGLYESGPNNEGRTVNPTELKCGCIHRWVRGRYQVIRCVEHERRAYERERCRATVK